MNSSEAPSQSSPQAGESVVYFVSPARSRRVKIGWTQDLAARLKKLRAGNHVELSVLLILAGDQGLESRLHHRFEADRTHNEWFKLSDAIKQFIADHGGAWLPPSGSYSMKNRATEDDVRAAMIAGEVS